MQSGSQAGLQMVKETETASVQRTETFCHRNGSL